jgi:hypothetical protein
VIDTGNVYDDVCTNLAQLLTAHKSELGVTEVHSDLPHTPDAGHVYVGWSSGRVDERNRITVDVYWIGASLGDLTGTSPSLDRAARQKADLLKRVLLFHSDCQGYCQGIEAIDAMVAMPPTAILWPNQEMYLGCQVTVTFIRPGGVLDDHRPI